MEPTREKRYKRRIAQLEAENATLKKEVAELKEQVAELNKLVVKLTEQIAKLSKNSSNSSKPLSSDIVTPNRRNDVAKAVNRVAVSKADPPGNSSKTPCPPIISKVLLHRSYLRPEKA